MLPFPDSVLDRHIAILGKTGSGKSNAAKVIAQTLLDRGNRVCIVDPTGTWWGLRLAENGGEASGYEPVIFGGMHADIEIDGEHGAAVAEIIATSSDSAVIDTRAMTVSARTRFFTDFGEGLLRSNKGTLHLIIDEAHLFAPQSRVNDPRSGAMVHAANNLVSLGRGIGLRIIMLSQRPAKLHKDSLTQVETLIAMRLIAPQDREAVKAWIGECADPGEGKEIATSLPSLKVGTGWVWSPEIEFLERVTFPLTNTFDSGTSDNNAGDVKLSPIDVDAISSKLAEIVEPKKKAEPRGSAPADIKKQLDGAWNDGYRAGYMSGREVGWTQAVDAISDHLGKLQPPSVPDAPPDAYPEPNGVVIDQSLPPRPLAPTTGLTPAKERILRALRSLQAIGQNAPSRTNVAWFAGASPKSSGYANNLGALRTAGLIDYPEKGAVCLTSDGMTLVPKMHAPTHDDVMTLVYPNLQPAQLRILQAAIGHYPDAVESQALAQEVDQSPLSSGFANNKGRLRSLGLITYPQPGCVRAADLLFPGA